MIELALGSLITLISLIIGYNLGQHQKPLPPKVQEQLTEIFKKKIPLLPRDDVGAVQRPTQQQIDRFKNPQLAQEEQIMSQTFKELTKE